MRLVHSQDEPAAKDGELTGRVRFRTTFFGRLVLEVEVHFRPQNEWLCTKEWRAATARDLTDPKIAKRFC